MLTQDQFKQLISENTSLLSQVDELSLILNEREKELKVLRANEARVIELQSRIDLQWEEFQMIQGKISEKEHQVKGVVERGLELHGELLEAAKLQQDYKDLLGEYSYLEARYGDILTQLDVMQKRNLLLEKIAGKIGEMGSHLANTIMERDELIAGRGQ